MITSLSIKNFRGIKEGKIEGLGRINIFVGKNNSGKCARAYCKRCGEKFEQVSQKKSHRRTKRTDRT